MRKIKRTCEEIEDMNKNNRIKKLVIILLIAVAIMTAFWIGVGVGSELSQDVEVQNEVLH